MLHMLQLRHLRLECFFLPVCVFRCLLVSLVSVLDGYFLTDEHSQGSPAVPHLISSHPLFYQVVSITFDKSGLNDSFGLKCDRTEKEKT